MRTTQGLVARVSIKKLKMRLKMQVKLYVIRDMVAGESGPVFTAKNDGLAIRQACQLMTGVIDISDYALYSIGMFDTESMELSDKVPYEIDFTIIYKSYCEKLETHNAKQAYIKEVVK